MNVSKILVGRGSVNALVIAAILAFVAACQSGDSRSTSGSSGQPATGESVDKNSATPANPSAAKGPSTGVLPSTTGTKTSVARTAPGEGTLYSLRYQFQAGERITRKLKLQTVMNVMGRVVENPPAEVVLLGEVAEVLPQNRFKIRYILAQFVISQIPENDADRIPAIAIPDVDKVERLPYETRKQLESEELEKINGQFASLAGTTISATVDNRGNVLEYEVAPASTAPPQLNQFLEQIHLAEQILTPLPEEPVGVGGKWETRQRVMQNSVEIEQVDTMTISEIRGNEFSVTFESTQSAGAQPINSSMIPAESTATLRNLSGQGKGEILFRLDSMKRSYRGEAWTALEIDISGEKNDNAVDTMKTTINSHISIQSLE